MKEKSNLHCASCGRPKTFGPDGVETVPFLGQEWCTKCAAIREYSDGAKYVLQPSPGLMVESTTDDPLVAWQDCYSMKPKKRILVKEAKAEIQRAWERWEGRKESDHAMFLFFGWLSRHRPYFLTFRVRGDPWQTVHSWLIQYEHKR
jgi:hypothetical protein